MAEMTLEKARTILSTTRKSKLQRLYTDLKIARCRYDKWDRNHWGTYIMIFFWICSLKMERGRWPLAEVAFTLLMMLMGVVISYLKQRDMKILQLFQDAAPHNITEILALKKSLCSNSN